MDSSWQKEYYAVSDIQLRRLVFSMGVFAMLVSI